MIDGPPPPALALRAVTVRYGARTALHRVDLSVPSGQFLALTGPNGSGKTTLMRAVLGFVAPVEGSVEVFGRAPAEHTVRERARAVAWVPQEEALRDDVPLRDYVLYGRYPYQGRLEGDTPEDRRLSDRILVEVGLEDRAADGILSLSGGERQRAVLARALAQETPLLLLDEPTAHLDISHQLDLLGRVRSLAVHRGVTVLAALHDLNLAARFADRIVVLSGGRRVADGPPAQVLSESLLARVWGVVADLEHDRRTGLPYLVPHQLVAPFPPVSPPAAFGPVHVVGGGGSATPVLRRLSEEGYVLTAGTLHLLDSDAETAQSLGVASAIEAPFAPIGPEVRARNRNLLSAARAVVVSPFAVGPSNLANLEDLRTLLPATPVILIGQPPIHERDFCAGAAEAIYHDLLVRGAIEVPDLPGVFAALARLGAVPVDRPA